MSLLRGVSFEHLKKRTLDVALPGCFVRSTEPVVLELRCADPDNAGWVNAYRKIDAATPVHDLEGRAWFDALLSAFAEHLVVGWKNVIGEDGEPVGLYAAGVVEIMTAYAEHALELARRPLFKALDPDNFRDFKIPALDAESLGKK